MPQHSHQKLFHAFFIILFLFMGCYLFLLSQKNPECFPDEPSWISSGKIIYQLYKQGASPTHWEKGFDQYKVGFWGHQTPPLGKLIIGMGASCTTNKSKSKQYVWLLQHDYYANRRMGQLPPKNLLQTSRLPIVFFGCLVLLFIYLICFEIFGSKPLSLLGCLFFFSLPIFQIRASTTYVDIPQLACFLLAIFLFLRFLKQKKHRFLILCSIAVGLSCAIKYSSGLLVILFSLWLLYAGKNLKEKLIYPVLIGLLSSFTFFVVNPYYYKNPGKKLTKLAKDWKQHSKLQQNDPQLKKQAIKSYSVALKTTTTRVFVQPHSLKNKWLQALLQTLAKNIEIGLFTIFLGLVCFVFFAKNYAFHPTKAWFVLLMTALVVSQGLSLFLAKTVSLICFILLLGIFYGLRNITTKKAYSQQQSFALFSMVFIFVAISVWLPFDWGRYYLPILVLTPIPFAFGISFFLEPWQRKEQTQTPRLYTALTVLFGLTAFLWLTFSLLSFEIAKPSNLKKASFSELLIAMEASKDKKEKMKISLLLINRLFKARKMLLLNKELQAALKVSGNNPSLWGKLALSYKFIGKPQKASSVIRYALRRFPRDRSLLPIARSILQHPKKK